MTDNTRSYTLPTQIIPGLERSHHLQDLVEIRGFLESRGVATANTRIERYCSYLERVLSDGATALDGKKIFKNSADGRFRIPADWYLYVLREVHELMWILKGLKAQVPLGVDAKLRAIVGGRDFAALDLDSQSRNTQFELRIASYFCQGGCEVDVSTDTDVVALTDQYAFFVECKRISSKSKLGSRLSEARRQLAHRMPRKDGKRLVLGCVAVDVTKIAFAHNGLTFGVTPEHSRDVIREKLVEIGAQADRFLSFDSCQKLLCYWLQIHIPTVNLQPLPNRFATRFSSYHIPRSFFSRKEAKVLAAFYDMFESVSQHDIPASSAQPLTLRDSVSFPAGTILSFDSPGVLKLLEQTDVSEDEQAAVIGTVILDGTEHRFTFFDLSLLPRAHIEEWKREMSVDPIKAFLPLLAALYLYRYPYEEYSN